MGKGHVGDFLSFWIDDTHSSDLGLTRVSDGSRYTKTLLPSFKDETAEVPGGDGTYYYGSRYEKKEIPIKVAFDNLNEEQFRKIAQLLGDKQIHRLVFDEEPYKEYVVKIASPPEFKYLCFDEYEECLNKDNKKEKKIVRIYKGDADLKFVCYDGYARNRTGYKWLEDYDIEIFKNREEWITASNISSKTFGWKILIGADIITSGQPVLTTFDTIDKIVEFKNKSLFLGEIYRFVLRDSNWKIDSQEQGNSSVVNYNAILTCKILDIPYVGKRVGVCLNSEKGSRLFIYTYQNNIYIWRENPEDGQWQEECSFGIYQLIANERSFSTFDQANVAILTRETSTFEIYMNNSGDIETPFNIKFLDSPTCGDIEIYLNGDKIMKIKNFSVGEMDNGNVVETSKNFGFQINGKTCLIEGLDLDGNKTGDIFNQYITSGNFKNLSIGNNILKIVKDPTATENNNNSNFSFHNTIVEYKNYYYI